MDVADDYVLTFEYSSPDDRAFELSVDGGTPMRVATPATAVKISRVSVRLRLAAGMHSVRLRNASAWMPDVDRMTIEPASRVLSQHLSFGSRR